MKCPYCGQEMKLGRLRGAGGHAVFWLPDNIIYEQWALTKNRIEAHGGVVLDDVTKIGFVAKARPESYWCNNCDICITKK